MSILILTGGTLQQCERELSVRTSASQASAHHQVCKEEQEDHLAAERICADRSLTIRHDRRADNAFQQRKRKTEELRQTALQAVIMTARFLEAAEMLKEEEAQIIGQPIR